MGNIKFMGELYKLRMISEKVSGVQLPLFQHRVTNIF